MLRFDQAGRGYHLCREGHPPPADAAGAERLVEQRGFGALALAGERWRVVPDPCGYLLFVVTDSPARGREAALRLVGARSRAVDVDVTGRLLLAGVRLRAGTLGDLVEGDASVLTDTAVSAEDVFGAAGRALRERLDCERRPEAIAREMAAFVSARRARRRRRPHDAAALARTLADGVSVDAVARALGLTARAAHRLAVAGAGLSPKRLMRIHRLYRALERILSPCPMSLAGAAAAAGYADQAHFSREHAELLGEPPRAFLARGVRNVQDRARAGR